MYLPKNYYVRKWLRPERVIVYWCLHSFSSLLALIFSVHIDKVLAPLCFRKVYVLKVSSSKDFLQITYWHKFPSNSKLAQSILRCRFPSKYKPSQFWTANFPPYISPSSKRAFEKYKPWPYFWNFTVISTCNSICMCMYETFFHIKLYY